MYRAYARIVLPDGDRVDVYPGSIVGRLWSAAVRIDDPRVSEAHALVSLRAGELRLIPLAGTVAVRGMPATELSLREGMAVDLTPDLSLWIEEVHLPDTALAVVTEDGEAQLLRGDVVSLDAELRLVPGLRAGAVATFFTSGDGWRVRVGQEAPQPAEVGSALRLGPGVLELVEVPLERAQEAATLHRGRLHPPMVLTTRYDSFTADREGQPQAVISGTPARIVCELAEVGQPVAWEAVAAELWPDEDDRWVLRQRWDRNLQNLRRKMRAQRIRPDLVRPDGKGQIELVLLPGDRHVQED